MNKILIKNALIVNEGARYPADVLIIQGRIACIARDISTPTSTQVLDAQGKYLLPGMIDDQVHFREPGYPAKGSIASESKAAVAGGITSFMEMPNTYPATTNQQALEDKYERAATTSVANYSFYLGATHNNLEEVKRLKGDQACGVKLFMGSSTGDLLVDDPQKVEQIFSHCPILLATHCEDTPTIKAAEQRYYQQYGDAIPAEAHAEIRSVAACLKSTALAVSLAQKHGTHLHVLHLTTADELSLFKAAEHLDDLQHKHITAEVCVHHLFFNQNDYQRLGHSIKCNPSIKAAHHQAQLLKGLKTGVIDIIATDHAPHTWAEKQQSYFKAPSGLPLVQHALLSLLDLQQRGLLSLELVVQKTSHAVAERFQLAERGYIREGYWADLVLVNLQQPTTVKPEALLSLCRWSPFNGYTFSATIETTLVNGTIVFHQQQLTGAQPGQRLTFNR